MAFVNDAQRRAAFRNMDLPPRTKRKSWKVKTGCGTSKRISSKKPTVKIVSRDEFDKHVVSTGNTISPFSKGLYVYKENTTYVNKDNVRGPEDLERTILHEEAHSRFGPDERKAEAYAVDKILTEYKYQDPVEHEKLMNAEMRLFHPVNCILKDPQTIPIAEKERLLLKHAEMILSPTGSLLMGENPNTLMAAPKGSENFKFEVKDHVMGVGARVGILQYVPDNLNIDPRNDLITNPDGTIKERVIVYVQGRKKDAEDFRQKIASLERFGKDRGVEVDPLSSSEKRDIDMPRVFHKLECEQMETFVQTGNSMKTGIDTQTSETKSMHEDIKGMREDIRALPKEIAKAMKGS